MLYKLTMQRDETHISPVDFNDSIKIYQILDVRSLQLIDLYYYSLPTCQIYAGFVFSDNLIYLCGLASEIRPTWKFSLMFMVGYSVLGPYWFYHLKRKVNSN